MPNTQETKQLLQRHYQEQSHTGNWGLSARQGYPAYDPMIGATFHPLQTSVSRFTNNIGRLSSSQVQAIQTNPQDFLQQYYNSSSLGTVRAFEGPSPSRNQSAHVMRFINSLFENNIGAHIGAGNPLSGMINIKPEGLSLSTRGFFDITSIPPHYLDPAYRWTNDDILAAKEAYMTKLWNNPEIVSLRKQGYDPTTLGNIMREITSNFFATLDQMKQPFTY